MAPPKPRPAQYRTRPSSSTPASPTKSSPKKSDGRRQSSSPGKRASTGADPASPGKASPATGTATKRKSATAIKTRRVSTAGGGAAANAVKASGKERSPGKDGKTGDKKRSAPSTPQKKTGKPVIASSPRRTTPKKASPAKPRAEVNASESTHALNPASLSALNAMNEKMASKNRGKSKMARGGVMKDQIRHRAKRKTEGAGTPDGKRRRPRIISIGDLEAGRRHRGGFLPPKKSRRRRCMWCILVLIAVLFVILVPVGILVIGKHNDSANSASASASDGDNPTRPTNANLNSINQDSIPAAAKGGYLDPFSWYDTDDFNVTYTNDTVGGLPIMGLNSSWDDSVQANSNVPPLNKAWNYGQMPVRGVNVGGWLSIEPFITPSLFQSYDPGLNIVDEWTLTSHLGATQAAQVLEQHYSSFINRAQWDAIRAAGFDHVRIPYSYWAVTTYSGDPYVPKIAWRYLLRGIEYARQNGLRVNLDFHGLPGSQNGWNHSGRQGVIGWLNGTDGSVNAQRSLDNHKQLAAFFAQPRYANVITMYGLVNEPRMTALPFDSVIQWTQSAIKTVRQAGLNQTIVIADGFLGLSKWHGQLQDSSYGTLLLDAHQYVIFNNQQLAFNHSTKLQYACAGWSSQMDASTNTATGFGPTICGEWSQSDTDCAPYLNNVNVGSRWTGTMNVTDPSLQVLTPTCPLKNAQCSCDGSNADPSTYSAPYKSWLQNNAQAQMESFEHGWGWFYWTWRTEKATQWSYKLGLQAGILPDKTWNRDWTCGRDAIPDYQGQGLPESF